MILTEELFDQEVLDKNIVIVDFWAPWCGPCKRLSPILDEISLEYNVAIKKLNIDDYPEVASKYNISSIPAVVVFENGIPVKNIIGAQPKHKMVQELEGWL
jgi:thioredoxin 1